MDFIKEMWAFLKVRKKFWLLPIIIMMVIFGGLLVVAQGSAVAPNSNDANQPAAQPGQNSV